ncbi:HNH endonuclease [Helicobacter pylori]|uniref:5-amino-6-(5-phosphoribosylamino)uracil reductase n=1 Tax=Helicobacter pylori (strain B8) TaxID=693745 RepID=D7FFV4_HELP3|nr:HNH endonuclease [Helicobacter pylori]AVG74257.1 5-amino-6-(5-phosphoribosylamino)uracil reductase [Helicobacter pylori]AVG80300.1 5-amino-6-(5-phosphoribosylamino)uracil reductase [Helicobacter pylori]AVG81783.1 5-amino-6-(5-phosphoribosylamino)uracil reductase [Helicobacter pylori]AVG83150.1 5-amino-6-(5-phosphoribosylamino)uracil reductase [Helicobacter pylori]AVG84575.1 5-amino-6-(5-phosphoribosylamino)uracil reductase [Helicobacter pylori]
MAEWKTDTEEVKEIVRKCREFKESLQEKRCLGFIKDLDSYALKIIVERRKIEMQLQKAIEKLKKAIKERSGFWGFLGELGRDFGNAVGSVIPPAKLGAEACEKGLNLMEDNIEKWEKNVRLLEQALEIYSIQTKASVELVEGAWESVKKSLNFYTDKHQEFIKRLNQASDAIDNEYNFPTPGVLMEYDFERPKIVYSPKKSVFDERLKDLREDFSASLYADWKDKINAFSHRDRAKTSKERELENLEDLMGASSYDENPNDELDRMASSKEQEFEKSLEDLMPSVLGVPSYDESLTLAKNRCVKNCKKALQDFAEKIKEAPNDSSAINEAFNHLETELERATESLNQKIDPILERNENYTQKALEYREFLESRKEDFIIDEQNPYPDEVRFNALRLAEFDSVFSAIAPLEDLDKTVCAHHALKALQSALKDNDLDFDAAELEQIAKGFIPRGYLWHFDANVLGNVALVREELLLGVKHTKGYSLWTEFLQKQN